MRPGQRPSNCRLLLTGLLLLLGGNMAWADKPDPEADLKNLRAQIAVVSKQVEQDQIKRDDVSRQLREVEQKVSKAAAALRATEEALDSAEAKTQRVRKDRDASRNELAGEQKELGRQLRTAYALGRQERLKLLLNQEDPGRLGRIMTWYEYVAADRARQISSVQNKLETLVKLEREYAAAAAELREVKALQVQAKAQLEKSRDQRQTVLARVEAELKARGNELGKLQRNELELQDFIESLSVAVAAAPPPPPRPAQKPFRDLKGQLRWPTRGRLKHKYGQQRIEGELNWNGVVIDGNIGQDVHAIADGRVVYADWLPRLGLLTIIEHDKHYLSLYAHSETLFKRVGDNVLREEVIATVGDTGGHRETGLYFEIRYKGRHTNPKRWCQKSAL